MGYPTNLKAAIRKLSDNIVIVSTAFSRVNILNFGARMALINYNNQVIVWSAIPYGDEVAKGLELLMGQSQYDVSYLIIPDCEHTMAAQSFKSHHPNIKIIGMDGLSIPNLTVDFQLDKSMANKALASEQLAKLGVDPVISDNFEFVYLPYHRNRELVMFDKKNKILFEADLLFNLGVKQPLEQYGPATGYPEKFNPHGGLSYLTRYMHPYSKVGRSLSNSVVNIEKSRPGLQAIYNWDFNQIVMCHGNVIDTNAKDAFYTNFEKALK